MSRVNFIFPREDLLLPKKNGKPAGFPFFHRYPHNLRRRNARGRDQNSAGKLKAIAHTASAT